MLWLCIRFTQLPLEARLASIGHTNDIPIAVVQDNIIIGCNRAAREKGVQTQQSIGTGYALSSGLKVLERNQHDEQKVLENIAQALSCFTPALVILPSHCVLLELQKSLKLFNGLSEIENKIRLSLTNLKLTYQIAIAHTLKAAEVLSIDPDECSLQTWNHSLATFDTLQLAKKIRAIKISDLVIEKSHRERIISSGIKNLEQLLKASSSSLRRRFGLETMQYIKKLNNDLDDIPDYYIPEENFNASISFIDVIHSIENLESPISYLIELLVNFFRLHQRSSSDLLWTLTDIYQKTTSFSVHFSDHQYNHSIYLENTLLYLSNIKLSAPIESINLFVDNLIAIEINEKPLFHQDGEFKSSLNFVNKIQAKLGTETCLWLERKSQNIPELTYTAISQKPQSSLSSKNSHIRPAWLFKKPQKIIKEGSSLWWNGSMTIVSSPESISGYWWKKHVCRKYYIAKHQNHSYYWIFHDIQKDEWFIHGIYT
ncbi:DNA polymerase Y family protein [Pleionea sp. CnH1-48]|uniref:Y-family DNA polymerase n=1 Tax=Pleionea sp. CnH1-48 TaxID=2954494 RepID=UPI002096ABB5|nr:DNA polymerase Y family protein [Pleionea sp. CnH1-48]MCO7224968.1 DNA polymerase Y family protein [Pleionea sp. CnH1-48]